MKYSKYHALGNDYIILNPVDVGRDLYSNQIRLICHRNYGVGSDGILFNPGLSEKCDFKIRIFEKLLGGAYLQKKKLKNR